MVTLTRGVHQALINFHWLTEEMGRQPTRLYEIVSLEPVLEGYYHASGYMCGELVLPVPTVMTWTPQHQPITATTHPDPSGAHPIVWRAHFPADITAQLVSWVKPEGKATNSDLDMEGSVIYHACMAD